MKRFERIMREYTLQDIPPERTMQMKARSFMGQPYDMQREPWDKLSEMHRRMDDAIAKIQTESKPNNS